MELQPIGVIHSPYKNIEDAPRQGYLSEATTKLEIYPQFLPGLKDIEGVTHLIILYWGHLSKRDVLQARTPFGPDLRGVFACRSPNRPNPIAVCVAELVKRDGNILLVRGVDAMDGSSLLDIKPYSSEGDCVADAKIGWLTEINR